MIGRSARDLDFWANTEARDTLLGLLDTQGDVHSFPLRAKSADGRTLQFSFNAAGVTFRAASC